MNQKLKKTFVSLLFFFLLLPSVLSTEISLPGYRLPGNSQYYSVLFDEEGEATVTVKLILHLPPPQIVLEIPGNVQLSTVLQEVSSPERRWDAQYKPLAWTQQLSTYQITLADPFQQEVVLLLSYKAQGYVQKELGNFNFNFPTIKMPSAIDSVRVAINVQPNLHLKEGQSKVHYVNNFFLSKTIAHAEASSISQRVMYARGMVKEAFALDPFENFTVSGTYGKSLLWLYRWETLGIVVGVFAVLFFLLFTIKKLKRADNKPIEITTWGFLSAFFSLGTLASTFWIMDNLRHWVGYRYGGFLALLFGFSAFMGILALLILPPLYLGKKYGYKSGFITAAVTVGWMVVMSAFALLFFL